MMRIVKITHFPMALLPSALRLPLRLPLRLSLRLRSGHGSGQALLRASLALALLFASVVVQAQERKSIAASNDEVRRLAPREAPAGFDWQGGEERYLFRDPALRRELEEELLEMDDPGFQLAPHRDESGRLQRLARQNLPRSGAAPQTTSQYSDDTLRPPAILDDFQVNENVGRGNHYEPAIATLTDGATIVVWQDYRNADADIYAQRYDSYGTAVGANFLVSDDTSRSSQYQPSVAATTDGGFVIAWYDYRSGNADIYAQRYSSDGTAAGANFLVNDDASSSYQYQPSVAATTGGGFVIAWYDERSGDADIYAQRYYSSGTADGSNFLVNDDATGSSQYSPSVAATADGGFVIAWEDYRNGNWDIYAQRYYSYGTALGSNFLVNDDGGSSRQYWPSVAATADGGFVIAWEDYRNGDADIYYQCYNSYGAAGGSNFLVNDDAIVSYQALPSVAATTDGGFVIAWYDYRNADADIYAQRYDSYGTAAGANFLVNDDTTSSYQDWPSVAATSGGGFVIAWEDERSGNADIYAQRYDSYGTAVGANFLVNDDEGSSSQYRPSVAATAEGGFVVTWYDYRNGDADIYAQRYNSNGTAAGANFLVNDDEGSSYQYEPSVAVTTGGGFVVAWEDYRNGNYDIYAQRYNSYGTAVGANFRVNDDEGSSSQYSPSIAATTDGGFVVAWEDDYRSGNYDDIYAQRYNSYGTAVGANFLVNDDASSSYQYQPSVAATTGGGFVIAWEDDRSGNVDIYTQRYNSYGTAAGANFLVNDDAGSSYQYEPSVAATTDDGFVIAWRDYRNANYDIYAQRYNSYGTAAGSNFLVNDDEGSSYQYWPSVAATSDGSFVIAWYDYRSGSADIYAQHYYRTGIALGGNFKASNPTDNSIQGVPSIAAGGDSLFMTWQDNRVPGQGWDIFANVLNVQVKLVTDVSIPQAPNVNENVTITCTVIDASLIQSVSLNYLEGGTASFVSVPMTYQWANQYRGTVPGYAVTVNGVAYYISAEDNFSTISRSDTLSIPVSFGSGTLTTSMLGSAFRYGFPFNQWRLISLPSDVDDKSVAGTIREALETAPSDETWKMFRYEGPGPDNYAAATSLSLGESYFLKQVQSDSDIHFTLGAGQSVDLTDWSLTIPQRRWRFVSSPYPFPVAVDADQSTFIGPYTYGAFGSGGQEGWSGQVQDNFEPWGGYIIYNNTDETQTLEVRPPSLAKALSEWIPLGLAKGDDEPVEAWLLDLSVEGDHYFDAGNIVGRLQGAAEGLDDYDHPEPPYLDGYISLAMERPDWSPNAGLPLFTSDVRSLEEVNGAWDLDLRTKGETGPIAITCAIQGEMPPDLSPTDRRGQTDMQVVLLDLVQRRFYDLTAGEQPDAVTDYSEKLPYRLKVIAGTPAYVQGAVEEVLAHLPEDFALSQNYPNPFNPSTTIRFALSRPTLVSLKVYNLLGQEVVTLEGDWRDIGYHEVVWDGRDRAGRSAATGMYFAVLHADGHVLTRKMVLLK